MKHIAAYLLVSIKACYASALCPLPFAWMRDSRLTFNTPNQPQAKKALEGVRALGRERDVCA